MAICAINSAEKYCYGNPQDAQRSETRILRKTVNEIYKYKSGNNYLLTTRVQIPILGCSYVE